MKSTLLHYAEKLKKPLHILTAFAVIICTAFCVPNISFASSTDSTSPQFDYVFPNWYITATSGNYKCYTCLKTDVNDVYMFYTGNYFVFCSDNLTYQTASSSPLALYNLPSQPTSVPENGVAFQAYSSELYYCYVQTSAGTPVSNKQFPTYSSVNEGLQAVSEYIESNSAPTYNFETTIEVPSGSVAYIGIPSSGSLSISAKTDMPMYTSVGSNTWSNVPQRVKQVSSLPDSNTTFPLAGSAIPNWTKTEPYNWLNQSKSAVTSTTSWSGSNGNFLTFYNPVYYMDGSIQASTNTVYLTISGYSSIRVYPLQNDMSITAGSTSTSPTDYNGYWDATITDNGDGTGSVSYNPSEGSNLPPTPTSNQYNTGTSSSIIDYINQINQTLTNFAESFINLLKAPVAHIQQLVSAGSDFVGQLSGLYSWLPTEVYNTLTSAIILCISVGVLKVLL